MKKSFLATKGIFLVLLIMTSFSFSKKEIKNIEKNFVEVGKNLYCSKYETSNYDYSLFLKDLKKENKNLYDECLYDSSKWETFYPKGFMKPMKEKYHNHPAYNYYPVVNISYNSAIEYCKWKTEKYNSTKNRKFRKVNFRLPSEKEWISLTQCMPGSRLPWYGDKEYNAFNKYMANVKQKWYDGSESIYSTSPVLGDGTFILSIQGTYPSNLFGLYDLIGNVSEMTTEIGKAKGGSWNNMIEDCFVDKTQEYSESNPELGFRVLMEIIER